MIHSAVLFHPTVGLWWSFIFYKCGTVDLHAYMHVPCDVCMIHSSTIFYCRCPPLLPNLQSVLSSNRSPVSIEDQCHNCYFFDPPLTPYFSDTQSQSCSMLRLCSRKSSMNSLVSSAYFAISRCLIFTCSPSIVLPYLRWSRCSSWFNFSRVGYWISIATSNTSTKWTPSNLCSSFTPRILPVNIF